MDFYVCWSIDCESSRKEINDTELGKRAINGFCNILDSYGWKGTLFLIPEELKYMPELLVKKHEEGYELALHLHPDESGYPNGYMGTYSMEVQQEIIEKGMDEFKKILGISPVSIRTGFGSANDYTFKAISNAGLKYSSSSFPGRKLTSVASNWAGAPLYTHYANPNNRMLQDGLDLVEMPISVDWDTMVWGGLHPQDLRVEYTDAKNHGFLIRKCIKRQIDENLAFKALLPFTHNIFDYSDHKNFRRETMEGMIKEIIRTCNSLNQNIKGVTISQAAQEFKHITK